MPQPKKPLEATFQKKVLRELAKLPNCFYYKAMAVSVGGIPDIVACIGGRAVFLELKRDEIACLSELQAYTLGKITQSGGYAKRVDPSNWPEILAELKKFSERAPRVQTDLQTIA